jgi:hypothetical protein
LGIATLSAPKALNTNKSISAMALMSYPLCAVQDTLLHLFLLVFF